MYRPPRLTQYYPRHSHHRITIINALVILSPNPFQHRQSIVLNYVKLNTKVNIKILNINLNSIIISHSIHFIIIKFLCKPDIAFK